MTVIPPFDGVIRQHQQDEHIAWAMLPCACPQNHAANLLPLDDGSLMCVWFGGSQEGKADISIWGSRLAPAVTAGVRRSSYVMTQTAQNKTRCCFRRPITCCGCCGQRNLPETRIPPLCATASPTMADEAGGPSIRCWISRYLIRQPISVMSDGNWLLPVFYCRTEPGEKWVGNNDVSAVKISSDCGKSWRDVAVPESLGCVHIEYHSASGRQTGSLLPQPLGGSYLVQPVQRPGESWSAPVPTTLPNNNSSIQATPLDNGELALVFNNMSAAGATERRASLYDEIADDDGRREPEATGKSAFWGAPRAPMTVAISADGGESWPWLRNLDEGDGYCMTNNSEQKLNREFSYPASNREQTVICISPTPGIARRSSMFVSRHSG